MIVLAATNDVDSLVAYLAALHDRHPVLMVGADDEIIIERVIRQYDPDVVIGRTRRGLIEERHAGTVHELHPDLSLLLSTSGSTGSSKLVRLSAQNLQSNAESIVQFLGITRADRAITSLPMQYCYGLSVINSYLPCGDTSPTGRSLNSSPCMALD